MRIITCVSKVPSASLLYISGFKGWGYFPPCLHCILQDACSAGLSCLQRPGLPRSDLAVTRELARLQGWEAGISIHRQCAHEWLHMEAPCGFRWEAPEWFQGGFSPSPSGPLLMSPLAETMGCVCGGELLLNHILITGVPRGLQTFFFFSFI